MLLRVKPPLVRQLLVRVKLLLVRPLLEVKRQKVEKLRRQRARSCSFICSPSLPAQRRSDWNKVKSPAADQIVSYSDLPASNDTSILEKVAVLKLNGGLGTTMGMGGAPKSAIEVREGMTFLDLSVRQIEVRTPTCMLHVYLR